MKLVKLLGAASIAAIIASPALAQQRNPVVVHQVNLKDAFSNLNVQVGDAGESVIGVNTALSNTATISGVTPGFTPRVTQQSAGAFATTNVNVGTTGVLATATTAQGNGLTQTTEDGRAIVSLRQRAYGDIDAENNISADSVDLVEASTTATANIASIYALDHRAGATANQTSTGDVRATNNASLNFNKDAATFVTTATGNALSAEGKTGAKVWDVFQTQHQGKVEAVSNVGIWDAANVTNATTAAGNTVSAWAEYGEASIGMRDKDSAIQTNKAHILAESNTHVDQLIGFAQTTALGVGNSAAVTNLSSDETAVYLDQINTGGVSANSNFSAGTAFGPVVSDATAVGNTISLTGTANLGTTTGIHAGTHQINSGHIRATTNINLGSGTSVIGTATAIGNSATITGASKGY
ncbi:MAG: holdfast anchor protein HfaD [Pseudomonadota bacterium]